MLAARSRLFSTSVRARAFHQSGWVLRQVLYSYDDVKSATGSSSKKRIIDVREPAEYAAGFIPSAFNVPLSNFEQSLSLDASEFEHKFGFKKPAKSEEVVLYCRAGVRSTTAAGIAEKLGWASVGNYKGSWNDWESRSASASSSASSAASSAGPSSGSSSASAVGSAAAAGSGGSGTPKGQGGPSGAVNLKELNDRETARAEEQQTEGNKTGDQPLERANTTGGEKAEESESVRNGAELAGDGDQKKFS